MVIASLADGADADLRRVAASVDTLVVLMAASKLERTCAALIDAGRPAAQPACLVQWAATSRQRVVRGTIGDLPQLAAAARIGPPATLIAGDVVALSADLARFDAPDPAVAAGVDALRATG